jgi:TonB family protein
MKKTHLSFAFLLIIQAAFVCEGQITQQTTASCEIFPVHVVVPRYLAAALVTGSEGEVIIEITISPKGDVLEKAVVSGSKILTGNSLYALRQWKFNAAKDQRVIRKTQIIFSYRLIPRDTSLIDTLTIMNFTGPFRVNIVEQIPVER